MYAQPMVEAGPGALACPQCGHEVREHDADFKCRCQDCSKSPQPAVPTRNFRLVLAYDGSEYRGWQVQPGVATIQGTLAEALARITGERVLPQGSGRTDAGVHALAQVASFALASPIPAANLQTALNDVLPPSIRVLDLAEAAPGFHARHSARSKTYRYRIHRGAVCPPFLARYVYHHPFPLDEAAMLQAAPLVEGAHDFTSFAAVDPERVTRPPSAGPQQEREAVDEAPDNRRTIFSSVWERQGDELVYTVRGSGFLHHMVRNLVGTFLLIGKGTLDPPGLRRILELKQRSAAGSTAPASGLYLVRVDY
jgi:tRNA pseudouridine38-40 synthase